MLRLDTCRRGPDDAAGRIRAARTIHLVFFFCHLPPTSPLTGAEFGENRGRAEEWPYPDGWEVSPVPSGTRLLSGGPRLDGPVTGVDSQTRDPLGIPTQCAGSCDQKTDGKTVLPPIGWRPSFRRRVSYNVEYSLSFVPSLCRETGKFVWPSQSVQIHTESPGPPIDKEYRFFPPDFEDVGKKSRW